MFYIRKRDIERFRRTIELFDENTNDVVRKITFRDSKDFDRFLEDFRMMRYPGYGWRYIDKSKN
jgi:hypothetical protein